jgi:hypothetical protein
LKRTGKNEGWFARLRAISRFPVILLQRRISEMNRQRKERRVNLAPSASITWFRFYGSAALPHDTLSLRAGQWMAQVGSPVMVKS